jgi:type II restriction enzyme
MKELEHYKSMTQDKVFEKFLNTLQRSITSWDYFVNWEKVLSNVDIYKTELNILNSLIGNTNMEEEFITLCKKYPEIKKALPILIAVRSKQIKDLPVLVDKDSLSILEVRDLFEESNSDYQSLKEFFVDSGLKDIFLDRTIKNLVDYVTGVEVGMDTNGRKNRTGKHMEDIVELEIKKICNLKNLEYGKEMTAKEIKGKWQIVVPTDKSKRRFDFVIKNGQKIILIEVNYYRGGGTKLKATAGEFINLSLLLKQPNISFVWITDGLGWLTARKPLEEAFYKNDFIFNLKMIKEGILEEIL